MVNEAGAVGKAELEQSQKASWRWELREGRRRHGSIVVLGLGKYRAPEGTQEGCLSHIQNWRVLGGFLTLEESRKLGTGPASAREGVQRQEGKRA